MRLSKRSAVVSRPLFQYGRTMGVMSPVVIVPTSRALIGLQSTVL
jgi:hypothetical protein